MNKLLHDLGLCIFFQIIRAYSKWIESHIPFFTSQEHQIYWCFVLTGLYLFWYGGCCCTAVLLMLNIVEKIGLLFSPLSGLLSWMTLSEWICWCEKPRSIFLLPLHTNSSLVENSVWFVHEIATVFTKILGYLQRFMLSSRNSVFLRQTFLFALIPVVKWV